MRYRRENGSLVGGPYNAPQDFPTEELPDNDPEVTAWLAALAAAQAANQAAEVADSADIATLKAIPAVVNFMGMSPAQVDAWIAANLGDLSTGQQRTNLLLAVSVIAKVSAAGLRRTLR